MEQTLHQDTRNSQHYKMQNSGLYQPINCEQEFNNQTNRTLTIPTSTQSFIQALPTSRPTVTQGFLEIKDFEKIDLPGNIANELVKPKPHNPVPSSNNYTILDISSSDKIHTQPQWQEQEPLTTKSDQQKQNKEKINTNIPIIIDNDQPFQINKEIISQIQKQVNMQEGVKQVIKIRNPDLVPTTKPKIQDPKSTTNKNERDSPIQSTSSPLRLRSDHSPEMIKHVVRGSAKPKKGRPPKLVDTSNKTDSNPNRRKRSSRNIATSKYSKLRMILEKLEDQEYSPMSPTSAQKRENRTLADFQVEVVALMKSEMSRIITRYAIHKQASERKQ